MNNNDNIDYERIETSMKGNQSKAEELLNDPGKLERFLQKLEKKIKLIPVAGNYLSYIPTLVSLVRSYIKKEYREIPVGSIIAIICALIYFVSPIDLIPDAIPVVGYLDDAAAIGICVKFIYSDLQDYRKWRKANGLEVEELEDYDNLGELNP